MYTVLKIFSIVLIAAGAFIVYGARYINERITKISGEENGENDGENEQKLLKIKMFGTCLVIAGVLMVLAVFR